MFNNGISRIWKFYTLTQICLIYLQKLDLFSNSLIINTGKLNRNNTILSKPFKFERKTTNTSDISLTFIHSSYIHRFKGQGGNYWRKYGYKLYSNPDSGSLGGYNPDSETKFSDSEIEEWKDYRLVDLCSIKVAGGDGGDGCISFRREKHVPLGGANGGNGGPGGSVYIECSTNINDLRWFDPSKPYKAEDGVDGKGSNRNGAKGRDLYLLVPPGTVIYGDNDQVFGTLQHHGEKIRIARGGRGGKGNRHFVTKINNAPRICEKGEVGISRDVKLIYKKMSDVALIGKSSIIKALTNAKPRIANFPFSTRFPIHGVMEFKDMNKTPADYHCEESEQDYQYDSDEYSTYDSDESTEEEIEDGEIDEEFYDKYFEKEVKTGIKPSQLHIVDVPGLIDGSSLGRGLGHDFLRQIERCNVLSYVIDSSLENPLNDYLSVRRELEIYNSEILDKMEIILLNKIDLIDTKAMLKLINSFIQTCNHDRIYFLSAKTMENMDFVTRLFEKIHSENILSSRDKTVVQKQKLELDNYRNLNPKKFKVIVEPGGSFRVLSPYLERKVKMMKFELPETMERLRNFLKVNKIRNKLVKLGLKEGSILNIGDLSFKVQSENFLL